MKPDWLLAKKAKSYSKNFAGFIRLKAKGSLKSGKTAFQAA
jgi:hypothetical protein